MNLPPPDNLAHPAAPRIGVRLVAVCHDCRLRHEYPANPATWLRCMEEWGWKHPGHNVEFHTPKRKIPRRLPRWLERTWEFFNRAPWWMEYSPNADIKLSYVASTAYTITLASLASSGTLVAGRESTGVDNTSNLYLDYLLGGKITTGTTVTAASIEVWAVPAVNDTPTYPDVFDGTDSDETVTSADIKRACLKLLASIPNDTTNSRTYWYAGASLAAACGGLVPSHHSLFVVHSSVAALHATGGNHVLNARAAYMTSA